MYNPFIVYILCVIWQVFAGAYPSDQSVYENMKKSIQKLTLNDASVNVHPDSRLDILHHIELYFNKYLPLYLKKNKTTRK